MTTAPRKPLPMQPIEPDEGGTLRFRQNALVRYLLDHGGLDMNHLAMRNFPKEDREQFAQLIGYSLSGYGELSYVSDESYETAVAISANPTLNDLEAQVVALRNKLNRVRQGMAEGAAELYGMHPDDFLEKVTDLKGK